jgi:flagellar biosynthetic protein FlhB
MVLGAHWMERSVLSLPVLSLDRIPAMFESQYQLLLATSGILLAWSALDYLVEWRSWEQRLRMSHQEMREEFKQTEGNPQIRGRIRSIQRQLRRRKLREDVARATVVITNPTHYAVALDFDFETMQAPKVLAKGRNLVAQQMKEEARWAGVPIVENPPLARSLFRSVEPGHAIPRDLYATVAAILAFLYRQQAEEKMRASEREREQQRRAHPETSQSASASGLAIASFDPMAQTTAEETIDSSDVLDAVWDEVENGEEESMKDEGENA